MPMVDVLSQDQTVSMQSVSETKHSKLGFRNLFRIVSHNITQAQCDMTPPSERSRNSYGKLISQGGFRGKDEHAVIDLYLL